jgi:5-methylcytosine-specific restriction endonuclease McrA
MPEPNWKKKRVKLSRLEYAKQREEIFERQDFICAGCGRRRPLTRDHKIKRSQLGGDERSNAQGLCFECHDKKDNRPKN